MRALLAMVTMVLLTCGTAHAISEFHPPKEKGAEKTCRLGPLKVKQNSAKLIDCPAELQDLIDRAFSCQHWTGEEPYDEARGHEIETALAELKCDTLSLDHDRLLKKYAKRPDVRETLQLADREYSLEF